MKYILISPFSSVLKDEKVNAKNYPYWTELCELFMQDGYDIIQLAVSGDLLLHYNNIYAVNLDYNEIVSLLELCEFWISVDSFLQHLNNVYLKKRGVVIWGKSDSKIFGYGYNLNILKDKKYLRQHQNLWWNDEEYNIEVFLPARDIYNIIKNKIIKK